ncbi:hypothetical protein BXZ70DRAFT_489490 [Cristinia sonorae]|uniref:Uncharacterized protein n=1 Tax=Cristinia sonorae TaxID=1940300 RepID=A0A8K0XM17_9AGAR|nr:hypothetical protein BXZ70DRAFT_489490 [Cristinia sonorae]
MADLKITIGKAGAGRFSREDRRGDESDSRLASQSLILVCPGKLEEEEKIRLAKIASSPPASRSFSGEVLLVDFSVNLRCSSFPSPNSKSLRARVLIVVYNAPRELLQVNYRTADPGPRLILARRTRVCLENILFVATDTEIFTRRLSAQSCGRGPVVTNDRFLRRPLSPNGRASRAKVKGEYKILHDLCRQRKVTNARRGILHHDYLCASLLPHLRSDRRHFLPSSIEPRNPLPQQRRKMCSPHCRDASLPRVTLSQNASASRNREIACAKSTRSRNPNWPRGNGRSRVRSLPRWTMRKMRSVRCGQAGDSNDRSPPGTNSRRAPIDVFKNVHGRVALGEARSITGAFDDRRKGGAVFVG